MEKLTSAKTKIISFSGGKDSTAILLKYNYNIKGGKICGGLYL